MLLEARAKINWTLDILGRREDGYHLMDMLMQSVTLADTVTITPSERLELAVTTAYRSVTSREVAAAEPVPVDERNIAFKAAIALQNHTGCKKGAKICLEKRIPSGAGMGGGSADAAAVLYGLNKLWQLELSPVALREIGLKLGADVPFMLTGGLARVSSIGEKIVPLSPAPSVWLVLLQPCDGLSTKEIFTAYDSPDEDTLVSRPRTEEAQTALLTGDLTGVGAAMDNVLEAISAAKRPAIRAAGQMLEAAGAIRAMMTGSGSVVYGVFPDQESAANARANLVAKGLNPLLTCTAEAGLVEIDQF